MDRLYELSGVFTRYWVERFGFDTWRRLYLEIDCDHAERSVEAASGVPCAEICSDFRHYQF